MKLIIEVMREHIFSIIIVGIIITIFMSLISIVPLFKSANSVMKKVIKLTPIGTHINDVVQIVNKRPIISGLKEVKKPVIDYENGYINYTNILVPGWPVTESGRRSIIGYKSVKVSYKTYFNTYFGIYWGFDEDGYLVDVFVTKDYDMISGGRVRRTVEN